MIRTGQAFGTAALLSLAGATQAHAQSSADTEIAILKRQVAALERKLDALQKGTATNTQAVKNIQTIVEKDAALPAKAPVAKPTALLTMPNNRPTFCTDDKRNCVALTGRLQFDAGGYNYHPNSGATNPQQANNGVNARRARIGVLGTFQNDWDYTLILDFGGTQDNTAAIENAFVTYKGIKGLYIEGGYLDVPHTLDETTGSFNIMFMERAAPQIIATNIASGDNRAAFGVRSNGDWWWAGSYVTGPLSGFPHNTRSPVGATARGVVVPINNAYGSLLLGADAAFLFDTGQSPGALPGTHNLTTLNDRIEVRIDPGTNALLNTGTIANVSGARVLSAEAAGQVGSFYAQGEFFDYTVSRFNGMSDLRFNGGYAQASYVLTGEHRTYNPVAGAYGTISPKRPVEWSTGGFGAWELAARFSLVNLNDQDVFGGELRNTTVGLNWYVNNNIRFTFNWIHGEVRKFAPLPANTDLGARYDVFAMRTQVYF
jgi:phosphate-selective porin OprO/OprP